MDEWSYWEPDWSDWEHWNRLDLTSTDCFFDTDRIERIERPDRVLRLFVRSGTLFPGNGPEVGTVVGPIVVEWPGMHSESFHGQDGPPPSNLVVISLIGNVPKLDKLVTGERVPIMGSFECDLEVADATTPDDPDYYPWSFQAESVTVLWRDLIPDGVCY